MKNFYVILLIVIAISNSDPILALKRSKRKSSKEFNNNIFSKDFVVVQKEENNNVRSKTFPKIKEGSTLRIHKSDMNENNAKINKISDKHGYSPSLPHILNGLNHNLTHDRIQLNIANNTNKNISTLDISHDVSNIFPYETANLVGAHVILPTNAIKSMALLPFSPYNQMMRYMMLLYDNGEETEPSMSKHEMDLGTQDGKYVTRKYNHGESNDSRMAIYPKSWIFRKPIHHEPEPVLDVIEYDIYKPLIPNRNLVANHKSPNLDDNNHLNNEKVVNIWKDWSSPKKLTEEPKAKGLK
ncbi:uncharacterized protein LOC142231602 [Haematobia irritans]|uniref:uncharacterized protein LOC142231602 n=1 Tax=Haematobia irritans TaxID=7368 RepID=UPI003F509788